jgi:hypothetical protein
MASLMAHLKTATIAEWKAEALKTKSGRGTAKGGSSRAPSNR